jgi:hypothetical protein
MNIKKFASLSVLFMLAFGIFCLSQMNLNLTNSTRISSQQEISTYYFSVLDRDVSYEKSHAESHGHTEIDEVRLCAQEKNGGIVLSVWDKIFMQDGNEIIRYLILCKMPDGKFALHILEETSKGFLLKEITGFFRSDQAGKFVTDIFKVIHYLKSTGWEFYMSPRPELWQKLIGG